LWVGVGWVSGCGSSGEMELPPDDRCVATVGVDLQPGQFPNEVDLQADANLEVAILSSDDFAAEAVDPRTATLESPDGSTMASALEMLELRDVNADGHPDSVLRFSIPALVDAGVLHSDAARLTLRIRTTSGEELTGCDRVVATGRAHARLPAPGGPHAVGTTVYHWEDLARRETFSGAVHENRELMVRFWYPAAPQPHVQPSSYFLDSYEGALAAVSQKLPPQFFDFFYGHAVLGAPLATSPERFPVLVLSPGYGMAPALYSGFAEELASRGYLVAAISHTHSSGPVVFPDGSVARQTVEFGLFNSNSVAEVWLADARFVLDQLELLEGSDPQGRFTGRMDLGRIGMFGHSFGGAASGNACVNDDRVKAGANLDGTFQGGDYLRGCDEPFLIMHSRQKDGTHEKFFRALRAAGYELEFPAAGHASFSDLPFGIELMRSFGADPGDEMEVGTLAAARGLELMREYLVAFFDKHLSGAQSPLVVASEHRGRNPLKPQQAPAPMECPDGIRTRVTGLKGRPPAAQPLPALHKPSEPLRNLPVGVSSRSQGVPHLPRAFSTRLLPGRRGRSAARLSVRSYPSHCACSLCARSPRGSPSRRPRSTSCASNDGSGSPECPVPSGSTRQASRSSSPRWPDRYRLPREVRRGEGPRAGEGVPVQFGLEVQQQRRCVEGR
jgi:predicted dienelactone hydrolase